jgi:hypothetical protein
MNKLYILLGLFLSSSTLSFSQATSVTGTVVDFDASSVMMGVSVSIEGTEISTQTNELGVFEISGNLPLGAQKLLLTMDGYDDARYQIVINQGQTLNLDKLLIYAEVLVNEERFTISLSDDELSDDTSAADNISGLLQSSQDVFLRTVAFEFSPSFFRVRGLDSGNGILTINGIEMNKLYNDRPQWGNWGGLNDVLRNREFSNGLAPSAYNFGGVLGSTNISTRASEYQAGGRLTYSSSNRSYTNRVMATYASGMVRGGWAYALSVGRRWGDEGFQDGTFYDANSFFVSVEKRLNSKHSINFTGIYTPNRRGKSSPNTQEVFDLKGIKYNEYWGYQDNEKRNSRVKRIEEPILSLSHYWDINDRIQLNTNMAYQFGEIGNSRLDFANGANPSPAYYQGLPSFALANPNGPDYATAYQLQDDFVNKGQIDWNRIYDANLTNNAVGLDAAYVLFEDRNDDTTFTVNSILNYQINESITLVSNINYSHTLSKNFASVSDMLGGSTYTNMDTFQGLQFDSNQPDRVIREGDTFRYNYNLEAITTSAYARAQFNYAKVDFYAALSGSQTTYQREGLFENEANAGNSFGKGPKLSFTGYGIKAGLTYKLTGKHLFDLNLAHMQRAPSLANTYTNSRVNHNVVGSDANGRIPGTSPISEGTVTSFDASYLLRSSTIQARFTAYYAKIANANETSFYYADGLGGFEQTSEFIQEVLQGIDTKHIGLEIGLEAQVTSTIKLKGTAALGNYVYDSNPFLYVAADAATVPVGRANMKNYKVAGGPQTAFSTGIEYRDPNYWWVGISANLFQDTFIDISPLPRTANFYSDPNDGLPFVDYDPTIARELLQQERFEDYLTVNAIGGKSWKIGDKFIGLFVSVNNMLNETYKTGGFEQGRSANYRTLLEDQSNPKRVFGPKYWYGRGTTYFVNLNYRF